MTEFEREVQERVARAQSDVALADAAAVFMRHSIASAYSYNFFWLGRPIIQYPQDIVAFQELVWRVRPDVIVETGIAHGGSLILSASLLALLDLCDATETNTMLDPAQPLRRVVGVDIDIRSHNRVAIEAHPMSRRITMVQGSSIDPAVIAQVCRMVGEAQRVLVCLDSNHTQEHVFAELEAYAPMVSPGSYCIVFDTVVEDLPADMYPDRSWRPGNSPKSAVRAWLSAHPEFEVDRHIDAKLQISVAPEGFLRRRAGTD